jgi:hypothetical protein
VGSLREIEFANWDSSAHKSPTFSLLLFSPGYWPNLELGLFPDPSNFEDYFTGFQKVLLPSKLVAQHALAKKIPFDSIAPGSNCTNTPATIFILGKHLWNDLVGKKGEIFVFAGEGEGGLEKFDLKDGMFTGDERFEAALASEEWIELHGGESYMVAFTIPIESECLGSAGPLFGPFSF